MLKLIKRWLGIERLENELDSLLKHYGVTLQEQPRYKVREPKAVGFKSESKK